MRPAWCSFAKWRGCRSGMYDLVKGLNTLVAIVALGVIAGNAEARGLDGQLVYFIVVVIAGLGGFYVADLVRKRNGR